MTWLTLAKDRDDKGNAFRTICVNMDMVAGILPNHNNPDFCELIFSVTVEGDPASLTVNHSAESILPYLPPHYDISKQKP